MYDDGDGKCKTANLDKAMEFNKEGRRDAFINEEYREKLPNPGPFRTIITRREC